MRALAALGLLLALAACSQARHDHGPTFAEARAAGEATVRVLYVPAEGWAYADDGEVPTGVTADLMRDFAGWVEREYDIALELTFVAEHDWQVFYGRVRDGHGGVFGLGNVTITDARRGELAFSPPYLENVAVLITPEDVATLDEAARAPEVLDGLDALAFRGTLHQQRLERLRSDYWPDMRINHADSNDAIIERVAAGGHFAYIDAYNYWRAREAGVPLRHHPAMDDPGERFGIIMPHDSDWAAALAAYFAADGGLVQRDDYRALLERHLGEAVAEMLAGAR